MEYYKIIEKIKEICETTNRKYYIKDRAKDLLQLKQELYKYRITISKRFLHNLTLYGNKYYKLIRTKQRLTKIIQQLKITKNDYIYNIALHRKKQIEEAIRILKQRMDKSIFYEYNRTVNRINRIWKEMAEMENNYLFGIKEVLKKRKITAHIEAKEHNMTYIEYIQYRKTQQHNIELQRYLIDKTTRFFRRRRTTKILSERRAKKEYMDIKTNMFLEKLHLL